MLLGLANRIAWQPVLLVVAGFALLVVAWLWMWPRRHRLPTVLQFLLIVLTVRYALFTMPLSWGFYYATIHPAFIDFRERGLVANKVKEFLAPPPEQKYVAVGSSQTRAVYSQFSRQNPVLGFYSLAGMGPVDYVEQYGEILKRRPKVLLLYVSEFDLARPLDLTNARISDLPLSLWPEFYRLVSTAAGPAAARETLTGMAVADLFPENKYSFLAADYAKQIRSWLAGKAAAVPTVEQQTEQQLASLKHLSADAVPTQMLFLEAFLQMTERDGIPVVLVEGQYNPLAYTDDNLRLNREIITPLLATLPKRFANVTMLDRADTREFAASDYEDGYHVKPEAGARFAAHLLHLLENRVTLSSR